MAQEILLVHVDAALGHQGFSRLSEASKRHSYPDVFNGEDPTKESWLATLLAFWGAIWPWHLYSIMYLYLFAPTPELTYSDSILRVLVPAITLETFFARERT